MSYVHDLGATRTGYTGRSSTRQTQTRTRRTSATSTRSREPREGARRRDYRKGVDPSQRSQVYRDGQWVNEGMALRAVRDSLSEAEKLKSARWNCEQAGVPAEYLDACAAEYIKRAKPGTASVKTLEKVVTDLQKAVEKGELATTPGQPLPAPRAGLFGIPLTYLLIGGAAIVGGVIIIRRRKKS